MSEIHYFQRYSQKENVVTNNTLRLLGQIYQDSPKRLKQLLEGIVDGVSIDVGVQMQQQTSAKKSIPDGALTQTSFKIIVETKRSSNFSLDQLLRHVHGLEDFKQKVLILLAPEHDEQKVIEAERAISEQAPGVDFAAVTFSDVIGFLKEELLAAHEAELIDFVDDYASFCSEENLLLDDDLLRAVPCGQTHRDNKEYNLYYAPSSRGYRTHQYVGIYKGKEIRYVGKLEDIVPVDRIGGELVVQDEMGDSRIEGRAKDIDAAMDAAEKHGYDIDTDHEFFLVNEFYEANFKKTSKYGMQGARYFHLREVLDIDDHEEIPQTEEIAQRLQSESWE